MCQGYTPPTINTRRWGRNTSFKPLTGRGICLPGYMSFLCFGSVGGGDTAEETTGKISMKPGGELGSGNVGIFIASGHTHAHVRTT